MCPVFLHLDNGNGPRLRVLMYLQQRQTNPHKPRPIMKLSNVEQGTLLISVTGPGHGRSVPAHSDQKVVRVTSEQPVEGRWHRHITAEDADGEEVEILNVYDTGSKIGWHVLVNPEMATAWVDEAHDRHAELVRAVVHTVCINVGDLTDEDEYAAVVNDHLGGIAAGIRWTARALGITDLSLYNETAAGKAVKANLARRKRHVEANRARNAA